MGMCSREVQWGLVNFDAALLWVKNRRDLTDALDVTPEFLRTKQSEAGAVIDYRNWHVALGRRFRSLKIWFVLRSYGVKGFQAYIRRVRVPSFLFEPYWADMQNGNSASSSTSTSYR